MKTYTIQNPPTLDQILSRVRAIEVELRNRGITPERVVIGSDLYLVINLGGGDNRYLTDVLDASRPRIDSLRGLALICDPLLESMEMRVIGGNEDNALRASSVREANSPPV